MVILALTLVLLLGLLIGLANQAATTPTMAQILHDVEHFEGRVP